MARAIWKGAVSFGLVSIPVGLFPAVRPREVHFHLLHDADGARIREKRVCSADGKEVAYEHVVKGYEIAKDQYVAVTPKELEAFDPASTHTIDIEDFVELDQIDPVYYDATYYLAPLRGGARAYALLRDVMIKKGRVAIGRVVLRTRQHLCAMRPMGAALALSTMQYADEIAPLGDLEDLPAQRVKLPARELELAEQLVDHLSSKFEPDKYKDEYREKLIDFLEKKAEGKRVVARPAPEERTVVDLFAALKKSLVKTPKKAHKQPEKRAKARHKAA